MVNLEIRVLGSVGLWSDFGRIPLGTPKQRCLLAILALTPGHPVSVDVFVERLWGEQPLEKAYSNIYTYVARLRRILRHGAAGEVAIERADASYCLWIDPDCIDVHRWRRLVSEANSAISDGSDSLAVRLHRSARQLWRGEPLAGLPGAWAERTRAGLWREWLAAQTECFAAELRLGRHAQVIGELSAAVSEHPLDEPLASQLMLGLYRSHRYADALAVFHQVKAELASQLGLDPSPDLMRLYECFLRNDVSLNLPGRAMPEMPLLPRASVNTQPLA